MPWRSYKNKIFLECIDLLTVFSSMIISYFVWGLFKHIYPNIFGHDFKIGYFEYIIIILSSILWVVIFNYTSSYSYQRFTSIETDMTKVIKTSIFGIFGMLTFIFIFRIEYIPRSLIIIIFIITVLMLFLKNILLFYFAKYFRRRGKDRKKLIIVGTGKRAENLINTIRKHSDWGLVIEGIVSKNFNNSGNFFKGYPVLSNIINMRNILHSYTISEVIITISTKSFNQIRDVISICEEEGIQVRLISDFFGSLNRRIKIDYIYDIPIVSIMQTPEEGFALFLKRIFDITVSTILLIILSPLFLIIALLIKLTSKGKVFYDWNVVGLNRKPFKSWKFRTMVPEADKLKKNLIAKNEMNGPVFKIKNDPRVTPFGRFLRKYSLDELPQLFSVLKGDMSFVGPRPVFPHELKKYKNWHRRKLSIKPGITCLWQVSGRNEINDFDEWARLDLEYIDNWSIWLDFKILFKTVFIVFTGRGAS